MMNDTKSSPAGAPIADPVGTPTESQTIRPNIRVLFVGDVIGAPGRRSLRRLLPKLRAELGVDLAVVNGENSAGGKGVSVRTAREMRDAGADVITTGNHIWAQSDIDQALADDDLRVVRPLNFPSDLPGRGACTITVKGAEVTVVSLLGRVFMHAVDDPFRAMDTFLMLQASPPSAGAEGNGTMARPLTVVDFHAEATSEKVAMGWHLAGRVSAVVGTHTHVPTADLRVLPGETGYVTDLGMVGPRDSVIGAAIEPTLRRFLTQRPARAAVPDGPVVFNAVLADLDPALGVCRSITRVDRFDPST